MNFYSNYILYVVALIYIIYKQTKPKEVDFDSKLKYILIILGLLNFKKVVESGIFVFNTTSIMGLIFVFFILAVGFAFLRAYTSKMWKQDGKIYVQSGWKSIFLWISMMILHLLADKFIRGLDSTLLLYLGISIVVQHWYTLKRVS